MLCKIDGLTEGLISWIRAVMGYQDFDELLQSGRNPIGSDKTTSLKRSIG